jgi:hypothetical protein
MTLAAGTTSGTYAPLEIELNFGTTGKTGTKTSMIYMSANGTARTEMDTNGYLFSLNGLTAASGKLFQANTAAAATHALRVDIGGTNYFVMLTNVGA